MSNNKNKDVTKKVLALGTALGVIAGVGAGICNSNDAHAHTRNSPQPSKQSHNKKISSKRPTTNAIQSNDEITTRSENIISNESEDNTTSRRGSGRRGNSSSSDRRKTRIKTVTSESSTSNESSNESSNTTSKRPTQNGYRTIEQKKQKSRELVEKNRSVVDNTQNNENRIIVKISTK